MRLSWETCFLGRAILWRKSTLFSASIAIHFSCLSFSKQCVQMRRRPYISSTIENLETCTQLIAGLGLSILSAMQPLASWSADRYSSWPQRFNPFSQSLSGKLLKISYSCSKDSDYYGPRSENHLMGSFYSHSKYSSLYSPSCFFIPIQRRNDLRVSSGIRLFTKRSSIRIDSSLLHTYLCL